MSLTFNFLYIGGTFTRPDDYWYSVLRGTPVFTLRASCPVRLPLTPLPPSPQVYGCLLFVSTIHSPVCFLSFSCSYLLMITFIKKFLNSFKSTHEDKVIPDPDRSGLIKYFTAPEGEEYSGDR